MKGFSLYTRVSALIVIQAVFVFAALALVLFFPDEPTTVERSFERTRQQVHELQQRIADLNRTLGVGSREGLPVYAVEDTWRHLADNTSIESAIILSKNAEHAFESIFCYSRETRVEDADGHRPVGAHDGQVTDYRQVRHVLSEPPGSIETSVPSFRESVYYCNLGPVLGQPSVLVAVVDHGLMISDRSSLQYVVLLLFLVTTLTALLTVYLIRVRLKSPLSRLLRGLEKTSAGELYYLTETESDTEVKTLTTAVNRVTRDLWENHQELKTANRSLKTINMTLLESQLFLATLIESSPFSVIVATPDGQIVLFNRRASRIFGYEDEPPVGKGVAGLFVTPVETVDGRRDDNTGRYTFDARCCRCDGTSFPAYVVMTPVCGSDRQQRAWLYIIRDISESTNFQEMMLRLDRYCTRGEMAADIAHEINNYLAVLAGNLDLLPIIMAKNDSKKVEHKLEVMQETVDKIARFADGLMDVPRDKPAFVTADLNQVVENMVAFLKPQNRFDRIRIELSLSRDLPLVECDAPQLQHVLMNFIFNSADALKAAENEKIVTVATHLISVEGSKWVRLEISDNGPGVPEEKRSDLFSRRFTTKRKGHGMGLITCRKVAEAHHGRIGYERTDQSCFYLELPLSQSLTTSTGGKTSTRTTVTDTITA